MRTTRPIRQSQDSKAGIEAILAQNGIGKGSGDILQYEAAKRLIVSWNVGFYPDQRYMQWVTEHVGY